jgi:hypothetical protein
VTYVTVEDSNDEWVTFAAAAAFTGVMIAWGCAVWGTGYYHPPYWGWGGYYPYYYPHYPTYGYGAYYNPWTGAYGRSVVAYGPYGGAGMARRLRGPAPAARWRPVARGAAGPQPENRHPRRARCRCLWSWGTTGVQRGDWRNVARYNNVTGLTRDQGSGEARPYRVTLPDPARGQSPARERRIYAGRDGNVKRTRAGEVQRQLGDVQQPTQQRKIAKTQAHPGRRPGPPDRSRTGQTGAGHPRR